jgi:hypothetical protein
MKKFRLGLHPSEELPPDKPKPKRNLNSIGTIGKAGEPTLSTLKSEESPVYIKDETTGKAVKVQKFKANRIEISDFDQDL